MMQEHGLLQMWEEMALPRLALAFKLAVGPAKVLIAFLAVVLICAGGFAMDFCSHTVIVSPNRKVPKALFGGDSSAYIQGTELASYLQHPNHTNWFIESNTGKCPGQGVFVTLWHFWTDRVTESTVIFYRALFKFESPVQSSPGTETGGVVFRIWQNMTLCFRSIAWAFQYHTVYSVVFCMYAFIIFCVAGGAICRCAALECANNEKPGLFEALEFVGEKIYSLISAPLIPALLMAVFTLFLILFGLAVNFIPWIGELILGVLLPFLLISGVLITLLLAASISGTGLMFPAIAYEGTTGLDAIGRSISYVLNKPVWMLFYLVVQTLLGTFFYLVMRGILFAVLWVTYHSIRLGIHQPESGPSKLERIWAEPSLFYLLNAPADPANWSEKAAGVMIGILMLGITALIAALVISYIFSSMTIIYSLMRRKVDKVPIQKVWVCLEFMGEQNPQNNPSSAETRAGRRATDRIVH
ncbi:MAG: hypothetical protein JXB18_07675 [Sedimentisphaerales bacterium]|nr:hypothetical protein [Sedimentisphaerales bacterium]